MDDKQIDKTAPSGQGTSVAADGAVKEETPREHDHVQWFRKHYDGAASEVIDFFNDEGISLEGKAVADIGCGDGVIDLGVFHKSNPAKLTGFDIKEVDLDGLQRTVGAIGLEESIPDTDRLAFVKSTEDYIPAEDDSFDLAFSWSVFEHVNEPTQMFQEIKRVLKPEGIFFLQIWPLFFSEHGGHLWPSYPETSYTHLHKSDPEIEQEVSLKPGTYPTISAVEEYRSLNRLTVDDLQRALIIGGLRVSKLEILSDPVHIPRELSHYPLSALGISGVKLLAVPAPF